MNIEKTFIINLEYRKDRFDFQEKQIKKYNLKNVEYFKAIRPNIENNEIEEWSETFCYHVKKDVSPHKFRGYQRGCLGCLKSHYELIKLALKRGYNKILVLEDDTEIIDDIKKLEKYSSQLGHNYDMLYLSGSHLGKKEKVKENIIKVEGTHTTGSYIITKKAMEYFVKNIVGYDKEVDVFYAKELQPKFDCYCVIPHLTKQMDGYSDIQETNVKYNLK